MLILTMYKDTIGPMEAHRRRARLGEGVGAHAYRMTGARGIGRRGGLRCDIVLVKPAQNEHVPQRGRRRGGPHLVEGGPARHGVQAKGGIISSEAIFRVFSAKRKSRVINTPFLVCLSFSLRAKVCSVSSSPHVHISDTRGSLFA